MSYAKQGGGNPPLPNSWFAYTIVSYYIAFFCIQKKVENQFVAQVLMGLFTILYVVVMATVLNFPPFWYITSYGINLGMFTMHFEQQIKRFVISHRVISYCLCFMCCVLYCVAEYIHLPGQSLLWGMTVPFLILFLVYTGAFNKSKLSMLLGKYSYEIYLVHGALFFLYPFSPIEGILGDFIFVLFLLLLTFFFSFALNKLSKACISCL